MKKYFYVNIINFENVDNPEGGGLDNVDRVTLLNLSLFDVFVGHLNTYLVVVSPYLAIIKIFFFKLINKKKTIFFY